MIVCRLTLPQALQLKYSVSGEREIELSCGEIELCNARKGADQQRLLWSESVLHPVKAFSAPLPAQLQLVYTTEADSGNRSLVANLHGTKMLLVPSILSAIYEFLCGSPGETGRDGARITSPQRPRSVQEERLLASPIMSPVAAGRERLAAHVATTPRSAAVATKGSLRMRLWLDASELVLPEDANRPEGQARVPLTSHAMAQHAAVCHHA